MRNGSYQILKDRGSIELYIDYGEQEQNKQIFDVLQAEKDVIEAEFGAELSWRRLDDKRASRILYYIRDHGSLHDVDKWDDLQDMMIDAMIRFDRAFRQRLKRIEV